MNAKTETPYEPRREEFWSYSVFVEFEMDGMRECGLMLAAVNKHDAIAAAKAMFPTYSRVWARRV